MFEQELQAHIQQLRGEVEELKTAVRRLEEVKIEAERIKAENEALKKPVKSGLTFKVSEKGALSVYGLGRFPVTLYKEQWIRLLDAADDIRQYLVLHESSLKTKEAD